MLAIDNEQLSMLIATFKLQYNLIDTDRNNSFLILQAAKFGDAAAVENHFSSGKRENSACNQLDEHQMSPLHYAARSNYIDVVETLIDHGAGN